MSSKRRNVILISAIATLVGLSCLFGGLTFSAFLNNLVVANEIQTDSTAIPTPKFGGGDGTKNSPFQISTKEHLRNLQKFTMLDMFGGDVYFKLTNHIDCNGEHFLPIGTEDHPFKGHFDGNAYTISNIVIDGANNSDIGLFGYTGITSSVQKLGLVHPVINVTANDGGGSKDNSIVVNTPEVSTQAKALEVTVPEGNYNKTNLPGSVILPLGNINYTETINGQERQFTLPIEFEFSHPNYVNQDSSNPAKFDLNQTGFNDIDFDNDILTTQVSAYVSYIHPTDLTLNKFTLERWSIEVKKYNASGGKTYGINLKEGTTNPNIYKNIYEVDKSGNITPHGVNVGFMIGHCDGASSFLGVFGGKALDASKNAIINMDGRSCRSGSSIIGKDRKDNPFQTIAGNDFRSQFFFADYTSDSTTNPFTSPGSNLEFHWDKNAQNENIPAATNSAANIYNEILLKRNETRAINFSDKMFGEQGAPEHTKTSNYVRYYPEAIEGDWDGRKSIRLVNKPNSPKVNALVVRKPLKTGSYVTPHAYNGGKFGVEEKFDIDVNGNRTTTKVGDSGFFVENGLWMYATREAAEGGLNGFVSDKNGFDVTINIEYKVNAKDPNTLTNMEFCLMANHYKKGRTFNDGQATRFTSDLRNMCWLNKLDQQYSEDVQKLTKEQLSLVNSTADYNVVQNRTLPFKATFYNYDVETSPMFVFGIGQRRRNENGKLEDDTNGVDYKLEGNAYSLLQNQEGPYYSGSGGNYNAGTTLIGNQIVDQRMYYQRSELWDSNIKSVHIYSIEVLFTTQDGNTATKSYNIDFLSKDPTTLRNDQTGSFNSWDKIQDFKPGFDYVYDPNNGNLSAAKNYYYKTSDRANGVTVEYNGPNGYLPKDTNANQKSTIKKNTNL